MSIRSAKLYLVLDAQVKGYDELFEILKQSVSAGVDVVQLRDKNGTSRDIIDFTKCARKYIRGRVPFIINDRVDVAMVAQADGVHLGQDDLSVEYARKMLGKRKIIGVSCQTMRHALKAESEGADYLGFGSVFKTLTKPGRREMDLKLLTRVIKRIDIPVFAIGGITLDNVGAIRALGVTRIAVTRAVSLSDNVRQVTKEFLEVLDS